MISQVLKQTCQKTGNPSALTSILGTPSPKDDIDGSEVAKVYYEEKNLDRIVTYCEKDTIAVAQLLLRFNNEELLEEFQIVRA